MNKTASFEEFFERTQKLERTAFQLRPRINRTDMALNKLKKYKRRCLSDTTKVDSISTNVATPASNIERWKSIQGSVKESVNQGIVRQRVKRKLPLKAQIHSSLKKLGVLDSLNGLEKQLNAIDKVKDQGKGKLQWLGEVHMKRCENLKSQVVGNWQMQLRKDGSEYIAKQKKQISSYLHKIHSKYVDQGDSLLDLAEQEKRRKRRWHHEEHADQDADCGLDKHQHQHKEHVADHECAFHCNTAEFIHESFLLLFHNSCEQICLLDTWHKAMLGASLIAPNLLSMNKTIRNKWKVSVGKMYRFSLFKRWFSQQTAMRQTVLGFAGPLYVILPYRFKKIVKFSRAYLIHRSFQAVLDMTWKFLNVANESEKIIQTGHLRSNKRLRAYKDRKARRMVELQSQSTVSNQFQSIMEPTHRSHSPSEDSNSGAKNIIEKLKSGLSVRNETLPAKEYVKRTNGSDEEDRATKFHKQIDAARKFNRTRSVYRLSQGDQALDLSMLETGADFFDKLNKPEASARAKTPGQHRTTHMVKQVLGHKFDQKSMGGSDGHNPPMQAKFIRHKNLDNIWRDRKATMKGSSDEEMRERRGYQNVINKYSHYQRPTHQEKREDDLDKFKKSLTREMKRAAVFSDDDSLIKEDSPAPTLYNDKDAISATSDWYNDADEQEFRLRRTTNARPHRISLLEQGQLDISRSNLRPSPQQQHMRHRSELQTAAAATRSRAMLSLNSQFTAREDGPLTEVQASESQETSSLSSISNLSKKSKWAKGPKRVKSRASRRTHHMRSMMSIKTFRDENDEPMQGMFRDDQLRKIIEARQIEMKFLGVLRDKEHLPASEKRKYFEQSIDHVKGFNEEEVINDHLNQFREFLAGKDLSSQRIGRGDTKHDPRRLQLKQRQIGPVQLGAILDCLRENQDSPMLVSRLDLSFNSLGTQGVEQLAEWIANCSWQPGTIKEVNAKTGAMEGNETPRLTKLESSASQLISLKLSQVGADHESLSRLLLSCTLNQSLISLDISNPGMHRKNAHLSAQSIEKCLQPAILNSNLQYLNLHNCGLKDTGLYELAAAIDLLEEPSKLQFLDLSLNRITAESAHGLVSIAKKPGMVELTLNRNKIGSQCSSQILACLCPLEEGSKVTLTALNMAECEIEHIDVYQLGGLGKVKVNARNILHLASNLYLERLDLRGNVFSDNLAYMRQKRILDQYKMKDDFDSVMAERSLKFQGSSSRIVQSIENISTLFQLRRTMKNLILSHCQLRDSSVRPIFDQLLGDRANFEAMTLNLSHNLLTHDTFAYIVSMLKGKADQKKIKLKMLNLSHNNIETENAKTSNRETLAIKKLLDETSQARFFEYKNYRLYKTSECPMREFVDLIGPKIQIFGLDLSHNMQIFDTFGMYIHAHLRRKEFDQKFRVTYLNLAETQVSGPTKRELAHQIRDNIKILEKIRHTDLALEAKNLGRKKDTTTEQELVEAKAYKQKEERMYNREKDKMERLKVERTEKEMKLKAVEKGVMADRDNQILDFRKIEKKERDVLKQLQMQHRILESMVDTIKTQNKDARKNLAQQQMENKLLCDQNARYINQLDSELKSAKLQSKRARDFRDQMEEKCSVLWHENLMKVPRHEIKQEMKKEAKGAIVGHLKKHKSIDTIKRKLTLTFKENVVRQKVSRKRKKSPSPGKKQGQARLSVEPKKIKTAGQGFYQKDSKK